MSWSLVLEFFNEHALLGLFLSALLSSTLLPGGSEALLAWQIAEGNGFWTPILVASAGNLLGSLITFLMGVWLRRRWPLQLLAKPSQQRAQAWLQRYGVFVLLFAWLPLIGDPLCLVAGWLGFRLAPSLVLIGLGKLARYLVVGGLFAG